MVKLPKTNRAYLTSWVVNAPRPRAQAQTGAVANASPGCSIVNLDLVCAMATTLSNQVGSNTATVAIDMKLPYSWKPYVFQAIASAAFRVSRPIAGKVHSPR